MGLFELTGQGVLQLQELGLAFVLSALVGLEREIRQKAAGLRTNTLVGVSAALFMLISKYGFMDVLESGRVVVDPSRVAAQIVLAGRMPHILRCDGITSGTRCGPCAILSC